MSSGWFDCTEPSLSTSLQYLVNYIDRSLGLKLNQFLQVCAGSVLILKDLSK